MNNTNAPKVKIFNPDGSSWRGTKYVIDEKEIPRVKSVDFHVAVDEVPTFEFEMFGLPDIEMVGDIQFRFAPESVTDAVAILRHELLTHGEVYRGFKASLKSALERYNYCGLPFEPEDDVARKILDFMIGEEK